MTTQEQTLSFDCDQFIKEYNKANPELRQLDRKSLAEIGKTDKGTLLNYKAGKAPLIFMQILSFEKKYKIPFNDIISAKSEWVYLNIDLVLEKIPGESRESKMKLIYGHFNKSEITIGRWIVGEMPKSLFTLSAFSKLSNKTVRELLTIKNQ